MKRCILTMLAMGAALLAPAIAAPIQQTAVDQGKVAGLVRGDVAAYLGIPYAAPPVGNLRWRAPEPVAVWKGVRKATDYGANCMQIITPHGHGPWTWEYSAQGKVSENCLFRERLDACQEYERKVAGAVLDSRRRLYRRIEFGRDL